MNKHTDKAALLTYLIELESVQWLTMLTPEGATIVLGVRGAIKAAKEAASALEHKGAE